MGPWPTRRGHGDATIPRRARRPAGVLAILGLSVLPVASPGCSREHYRETADEAAYEVLEGTTDGTPWPVPEGFSVDPPPASRLHDPSDPDHPELPHPGPHLYDYELPGVEDDGLRREDLGTRPEGGGPAPTGQDQAGLPVQPIPMSYWEAIPGVCLARMLEFASVRDEWIRRHGEGPPSELLDDAPRLSLAEIVELALLNSREYQSQKESLYLAALAVTRSRFDYVPWFTPGGNGVDADWTQERSGGATAESSVIGSAIEADALLATGGSILARFANQVVFTFDGPEGFTQQVGSEALFSFTQSLLQRDIRLEPLVQAERNLVYAARSFARFRRTFFFDLASRYYGILSQYRGIEIESQNYFSLVRTFEQARAELRAGVQDAPNPVAVDQFEQSMLSGRSSLIAACNRLESSLDDLKVTIGVPTETEINIDLGELEELTLRDQTEVAAERVRRWLERVRHRRNQEPPERGEVLNADVFLIERLLEWLRLRARLEEDVPDVAELELLLARLRLAEARVDMERALNELQSTREAGERAPGILVYERLQDVVVALIELARRQAELLRMLDPEAAPGDGDGMREGDDAQDDEGREGAAASEVERYNERLQEFRDRLPEIIQSPEATGLEELLEELDALRAELEATIAERDEELGAEGDVEGGEGERLERTLERTDQLIELAENLLESALRGLPPLDIEADEAMGTALVQRLDLMNERGRLADDLRGVKLAADELRSVLDFSASHSLRTRGDDDPFEFTGEDSTTRLALSFDLPLDRVSQRNAYRSALLDYQAGRRSLMSLEDTIKRNVRDELRNLEETRIQYPISVTQAALAAEEVINVRLQLSLGVQGVRGTDLLDALQRSREALIAVANDRIGYIVDRAGFVLDLELLRLDERGMWPRIDDPSYRPVPDLEYPENAGPTYGHIPWWLLVSDEIRSIEDAPQPGVAPAARSEEGGPPVEEVPGDAEVEVSEANPAARALPPAATGPGQEGDPEASGE